MTTQRLPISKGDLNTWDAILNGFMLVAHNSDGSIKNQFINVTDPAYGAVGDGVTDNATAFSLAMTAANNAGGGTLFIPAGTYITSQPFTLTSNNITICGVGYATIIQPKTGFSGNALIYSAGGIQRTTIRDLYLYGGSTTYSSNPACDGIQLNSAATDTTIDRVYMRALNGYPIQILVGASGFITYTILSNSIAHICKGPIRFVSTTSARGGGVMISNCASDAVQAGHAWDFEEMGDVVMTNCMGNSVNNSGSMLHLKGSSFMYFSTIYGQEDSPNQTTPTVQIEDGPFHHNDQICFHNMQVQRGSPGMQVTAVSRLKVSQCNVYFNQTHGVQILDNSNNGTINFSQCQFVNNNQAGGATTYDLQNTSTHGNIALHDCQFSTTVGSGVGKVAQSIDTPNNSPIDVQDCEFLGGTPVFTNTTSIITRNNQGYNPVGPLTAPGIPASGTAVQNTFGCDCTVYIIAGTITVIGVGNTSTTTATGLTSSAAGVSVFVGIGQYVKMTYSVAPTSWAWFGN